MIRILTRYSETPVVFVSGQITGEDAGYLKSTLLELIDRGYDCLALELREVTAVDNAGIGALIAARGRLSQVGGSLCLVSVSPEFHQDLSNTGMIDLFPCYTALDQIPASA